ncbi:MAG: acetophenone carboxylase [Actinobacteria bacterium]|jgi:acetophenone carboxylase|nr:MAG: acetophenone carboxylase [Actinomycetota bacterium]
MSIRRITEYLDVDAESMMWLCNRCGHALVSAERNYKEGCRVRVRNPREIHDPVIEGEWSFAPDPGMVLILEYYCPNCGVMIENDYLPPGHPVIHDIRLDLESLKQKERGGGA